MDERYLHRIYDEYKELIPEDVQLSYSRWLEQRCIDQYFELRARGSILDEAVDLAQSNGMEGNSWIEAINFLANLTNDEKTKNEQSTALLQNILDSQIYTPVILCSQCGKGVHVNEGESCPDCGGETYLCPF